MTSKTPGARTIIYRISRDTRTAPINTVDNGGIPLYTSLDDCGPLYITSHGHELYAAVYIDFA